MGYTGARALSTSTPPKGQAAAIRAARKAARMSQRHLAQAAGVSDRTVRRAEAGLPIAGESALALCAVLGLDVSALGEVEVARPGSVPGRHMPLYELDVRLFVHKLLGGVGGLHPVMLPLVLACTLWLGALSACILVLAAPAMYVFSRRYGATHAQAMGFVRGKSFADGEPVNLEGRRRAQLAGMGPPPTPA